MRTPIIILLLTITFGSIFYIVRVIFSEYYEYTHKDIAYYLLTPSELANMTEFCLDKPVFIYSAGDGNKPLYTTMNCTIPKNVIENHITDIGFRFNDYDENVKGDTEIEILTNDIGDMVTSITLFIY
ncbi:hypothetical protein [Nitrincola iocasae]|uniref:Uncharacterized protein n=1 Tax=Nitrincola iocasae TaxID=2614693 RepID=A0A5J6LFI5_9GAMM|nr:hypothetical protein [Nitrincola iocasae]QEW07379.1 hypothetical protein F5I99_13230 [Nitrincola iocasae]